MLTRKRDADVTVEAPGPLPRALAADADEDQRDRVGHELRSGAGRELLEQQPPDVAVDLP